MPEIEQPERCQRIWDGGRQRLWTAELAELPAVELALDWQIELPAPRHHRIRPSASWSLQTRYWRHRTPRPDACSLSWACAPLAGESLQVQAIALPEADHKRSFACFCDGIADTAGNLGMYPLGGIAIRILACADDGRSSPEGLRLAAAEGFAAVLLAGYRCAALPYL